MDIKRLLTGRDRPNANLLHNPETINLLVAEEAMSGYILKILPEKVAAHHKKGDLHYHDLGLGIRPFCRSWDMRPIFMHGLSPTGDGRTTVAGPAKHAHVAIAHLTKVLSISQTLHSGGQGALFGTVFLAPYMEGKSFEEIKQLMQYLIYELNQMPVARGGQVVFSSLNLVTECPKVLQTVPAVRGGVRLWRTYGTYNDEIQMQFKAIMEVMLEGDAHGKPFPFPKLEVLVTPESIKNAELYTLAAKVAIQTGNIYWDKEGFEEGAKLSVGCTQCCAYSFEEDEDSPDFEDERFMVGGKSWRMGGLQAITLNLPRAAQSGIWKETCKTIYSLMDVCFEAFDAKRAFLKDHLDLFPFLEQSLGGAKLWKLDGMVGEVGFVGLYDAACKLPGHWRDNMKNILQVMSEYIDMHNAIYPDRVKAVLARAPAEQVAGRFARIDGFERGYYSNGLQAFDEHLGVMEALELESELWPYLDGGCLTQVYLGDEKPNAEALWEFTKKILLNMNIKYLSYTVTYTKCDICHKLLPGIVKKCDCGSEDLVIVSRVTGYMSPLAKISKGKLTHLWNDAKLMEFGDRPIHKI